MKLSRIDHGYSIYLEDGETEADLETIGDIVNKCTGELDAAIRAAADGKGLDVRFIPDHPRDPASFLENRDLDEARKTHEVVENRMLEALSAEFDRTDLTLKAAEVREAANRLGRAAEDASIRLGSNGDPQDISELETEARAAERESAIWWRIRDALLGYPKG